jgi:hypothetical protein
MMELIIHGAQPFRRSQGSNSCPASLEILHLIWNAKVYYCVHKMPPFGNQVTLYCNAACYTSS